MLKIKDNYYDKEKVYQDRINKAIAKVKLERKTSLALKQTFTVSVLDQLFEILKGDSNE